MKSSEAYRVLKAQLDPLLRKDGFKRAKGLLSWMLPHGNRSLVTWCQVSQDGWDNYSGSKFTVEFQLSDEPIAGDRALVTQVHVAPGHEAGWARWYRDRHVPDALAVPGFFAGPMWQLEAFDVNTAGWHVAPRPRFTHVLPLTDQADWVAGPGTPEFLALAADTQTTWGGAVEHVTSQLCERIA